MRRMMLVIAFLGLAVSAFAQEYDFLLKGGHAIDARNKLSAVRDVAIKDGKIAAVAAGIPATHALKTVDVSGMYVTPGLNGITRDDWEKLPPAYGTQGDPRWDSFAPASQPPRTSQR
jgi:hypothetical protein